MHHTHTSAALTLSRHTSLLSWLKLFGSPTRNSCMSFLLPPKTTSYLCISNVITSSFLCVHICIQPRNVVHFPVHALALRPLYSHSYPDWSSLLILALNVAGRLPLSAPVLLLLCDVNEAFWFVIKRCPRDTERLINQDKAAGEGWYTAKHQPSSEYTTNESYINCWTKLLIVCMSQAFQNWGRRSL